MSSHCLSICFFNLLLLFSFAKLATAEQSIDEMAMAAERLLNSLDEGQRGKAVFEVISEERQNWHFLPDSGIKPDGLRKGLPIKDMTEEQRILAHALVSTGLSHKGYLTAMTILSLEKILRDLEGNQIRDPELYYLSVFGKPGDAKAWGWRFEGHHLSINVSIVDGKLVAVTPSFFGSNPAHVSDGPRQGLRTLSGEESLARELVKSLSEEQQTAAVLSDEAPKDILTMESRKVSADAFTPPQGIAGKQLNDSQRELLLALVQVYAQRFRPEFVTQIAARSDLFDVDAMHFAWAGGLQEGEGHYYRIQTRQFLIEYDNTQNGANHVHSVWRDFEGDFGADLLRQHYETDHSK
ncbi:MAG: DUF3500 domain-containing protein [Planctomycetales bacterium]|nr:DUF3500 domain-containing protein [Planctomycetales bacterium]